MTVDARKVAFSVLVGALCIVVLLVARQVGASGRESEEDAAEIEAAARKNAAAEARKEGLASGRKRGYAAGLEAGRRRGVEAGTRKGTKNGRAVYEQTAPTTPPVVTTPGTTTPPSSDTPSANSPEGRRLLEESPDCQNQPPPPPDYDGPVQC